MKVLKYIVNEEKKPIIFSTDIIHSEILTKGLSAGFLILKYDLIYNKFIVTCYGESSSLKIKKGENDESLIEDFLNNQYVNL